MTSRGSRRLLLSGNELKRTRAPRGALVVCSWFDSQRSNSYQNVMLMRPSVAASWCTWRGDGAAVDGEAARG
jgi:hypothetical protein